MRHSTYLIIGAGMAADAAARGIRDIDPTGTITIVGAEFDPPYKRPLLSKGLWQDKPFERVWSGTEKLEVDIRPGREIRLLDPIAHQAVDDRGQSYLYDKLLLATGARPRRLPVGGHLAINFRTLDDYRRLRALTDSAERIAVVGGGFIGSELAASLAANGKTVTMILPGNTIGERIFPLGLGRFLKEYYRQRGVTILTGQWVDDLREDGEEAVLRLRDVDSGVTQEITVDGVVAGIGVEPNVELAEAVGLTVSDGIVVDEYLRTSHPDIYAAGDVANFWQDALGARRRVEHEDNAKTMGRLAGQNMAGRNEPYAYLPFFYSDLFDMGYEAVGEVDARLDMVEDWDEPYQKGAIYYRRDDRVRGVLLWNIWGQVDAARSLITSGEPIAAEGLRGRLLVAA
jgi:3-phenylpropionate/trans-cinnamate dioxygenase ferredoxin reductase subunit